MPSLLEKRRALKALHERLVADPHSGWSPDHGCHPDRPAHVTNSQGQPIMGLAPPPVLSLEKRPIMLINDQQAFFAEECVGKVKAGLAEFLKSRDERLRDYQADYEKRLVEWQDWNRAGIPVERPVEPQEDFFTRSAREAIAGLVEKQAPSGEAILIIHRNQANALLWALQQVAIPCCATDLN
jgi:hypothetical protein